LRALRRSSRALLDLVDASGHRWPLTWLQTAHTVDKHIQPRRIVNSLVCSSVRFRSWCMDLWNFICRVRDMCTLMNWL
jgi:hypothetical protein